jgi:hypothetical protein
MTKIRTDEGALGRTLQTKRAKIKDDDTCVCETRLQMPVKREEFATLAGLPPEVIETLYTEEGAPIANLEIRVEKRELSVNGKCWRGEGKHAAELKLKKAIASVLRFKLEPSGAIFICTVRWRAAGDEVEDVKDLLGQWCSLDLSLMFVQGQQEKLDLGGGSTKHTTTTLTVVDAPVHTECCGVTRETCLAGVAAGEAKCCEKCVHERPLRPDEDLPAGVPPIRKLAPSDQEPATTRLRERVNALGLGYAVPDGPRVWFAFSPAELQKIIRFCDRRENGETPNPPASLKQFKQKKE